jgi:hypothetical protein
MEISTISSKMVRQRLGSILLDLHYKPETVFAIIKPGNDDYAAIICNPQWLRDQGVEIPELKKESKPSKKK